MGVINARELRGKDSADRARVGGTVGVATSPLVHGAHIEAGGATNALQGFPADFVGHSGGAAIIHQHDVEILRAVVLGYARPQGGVGVHALAGRGTRQQLQEHLVVPEGGENLFDTHHADEGFRQGQAHAAVTFGLHNGDVPGFGDTEVSARNGDLGLHELLP